MMDSKGRNNSVEYEASQQDGVVAEIDVFTCGAHQPRGATGYLLQFPQRTVDRPYGEPSFVRLKPKVKRMQWEVPLDMGGNWNPDAPPSLQLKSHTLQSNRVDPGVQSLAVGVRRGNALYLLPVSEVLQLRHSLAYLDREKEKEKDKDYQPHRRSGQAVNSLNVKQEDFSELMPITVQVKRHETEQQTEARLRSYQHHSQQEESDHWLELKFRSQSSAHAQSLITNVLDTAASSDCQRPVFSHASYLKAIAPKSLDSALMDSSHDALVYPDSNLELGKPSISLDDTDKVAYQFSPDAIAALHSQLDALFLATSVVNLDNVRALLSRIPNNNLLSIAAEKANNASLHAAILSNGRYLFIRGSYVPLSLNNPALDPLRNVVLELLREREEIRRSDVVEAAKLKGVTVTDASYQRVMKDLCHSRGSIWTLKPGGIKSEKE
jgi:DNA-directed RNA polymerase-3 subunit RPC5